MAHGTHHLDELGTVVNLVIVVIGGDPIEPVDLVGLPGAAFVIAADSGLDHARGAGLTPGLVVGDFDSVSEAGLAWARERDVPLERHPPAKDATDTELALGRAVAMGATEIIMLGGGGDRLDHSIAAITALGHPSLAICRTVSARLGNARVTVLHGPREGCLAVGTGSTFSLLALHGTCAGIDVDGARWPLHDAIIEPGSTVGISNVSIEPSVRVRVRTGVMTVIVPAAPGRP